MKYLIAVALVGCVLACEGLVLRAGEDKWATYKQQHGKSYESAAEESMRRSIFEESRRRVEEFNAEQSELLGYKLGLNHLADWTEAERSKLNGYRLPDNYVRENTPEAEAYLEEILARDVEVPDHVDWRKIPGRVTPVKNQGQCGSCWSFSATGVLEGQEYRKSNKTDFGAADLIPLSEQNIVDCDHNDDGCGGGLPSSALDFIRKEGGVESESSYPYIAEDGKKCQFNKNKVVFTDKGHSKLPVGDEEKLKQVVAKFGPVSVGFDASHDSFQLYKKGVYHEPSCGNGPESLDHGILIVGYGTDKKQGDYWIVKNSWGTEWGMDGYFLSPRNKNNTCGIATDANIPIV